MLDEKMHGNYIIVCGNCDHEHYRVIRDGVVVDDGTRWSRNNDKWTEDKILIMKSACYKEKPVEKLGKIAQFRAKVAAGLAS